MRSANFVTFLAFMNLLNSNKNSVMSEFSFKVELPITSELKDACKALIDFEHQDTYGSPVSFKVTDSTLYVKCAGWL